MRRTADHPDENTMSFGDHLDDLRRRLLLALVAPLPLFIVAFFVSDALIEWLLVPVYDVLRQHDLETDLQVLSPPEFLLTKLKLSMIAALVVSTPWILYQAWLFVAPGLYRHEQRFVRFLLPGSAVLTVAGISLLYYVMLPLMLHVLVMITANIEIDPDRWPPDQRIQEILDRPGVVPIFTTPPVAPKPGERWVIEPDGGLYVAVDGGEPGTVDVLRVRPRTGGAIAQSFRVSSVVNFTLVLAMGIVVAFQMPLVIVLLGWLNLASVGWLRRQRRYALVICGVVSAVITPADAVSMVIMLLPLYGLYELGILLLLIAPASAVAEGRLLRRGSDKGAAAGARAGGDGPRATQPVKPARPAETVRRGPDEEKSSGPDADGGDDA